MLLVSVFDINIRLVVLLSIVHVVYKIHVLYKMSTNVVLTSRINKTAIDQILNLVTRLKTEYETQRLKRNERSCCLKRNSNLYRLNKHPRISVNARFFFVWKKRRYWNRYQIIYSSIFFHKYRRHDKSNVFSLESKVRFYVTVHYRAW